VRGGGDHHVIGGDRLAAPVAAGRADLEARTGAACADRLDPRADTDVYVRLAERADERLDELAMPPSSERNGLGAARPFAAAARAFRRASPADERPVPLLHLDELRNVARMLSASTSPA